MNGPGVVRPRQRQRTPTIQSYTIITVGQRCVGKSSLLRLFLDTLPLSPHATHDQLRSIANFVSSPNPFCECYLETLWDNERLLIHLIDTPPLNGDTLTETISLIEERYIRGARSDEDDESTIDDSHIHLCLYLLDALQHDFRPDIAAIGRLSVRVNVLPILARSDMLTLNELINLKQSIRGRLADAGLGFGIFDKQGDDGIVLTPQSITGSPRTVPLLPYSIFSPEHSKLAYEPVLNLWMDKLNRRRADFQSLDNMKMDIDRKVDESQSTRFNPSLSSRNSVSPQPPAPELEVRKPDLTATSVTQQDGELTPFPTTSHKDEKSYPRTPPTADPSAPLPQTPSPSAVKDDPVRVESETKHSPSVPNPEDTTQTEIEVKSSDSQTSGFVKPDDKSKISIQQRPSSSSPSSSPSSSSSSPSPQNAFGPEVKISPSSTNIPLKPSPCPVNCTEENHGRLICNNSPMTVPFSTNDSELTAGKFVRVMRWGLLDCIDRRQSDFVRLRDEIMVWRKELKTYTREYLYSCFKDDSFSRLAAQAQQQQQQQQSSRDILPEPLHSHPRRESVSRDCSYRISPPPSLQHGLRGRSTSITESVAERDRPLIPRSVPSYSISRDRDSYPYEREKDLDGRYIYHDRSRENPPSPERERDYAHLSPSAGMIMPISNERKLSMSNGDRERSKYRSPKHEHGWEDRLPVLPSIERDRYHRVSPNSHASPPSHSHPGPYPPQYNHHAHARDKEQFDRERAAREKISPLIRERDMITPPLQRSGSPGIPVPIGASTGQTGQVYGMNPNISPNMSAGGKQLDVHSLLNHNHHGQGLELGGRGEKEWERRDREREISPNPQSSLGMSLSIPISNMPMSSGSAVASVVGTPGPSNNTPVSVPNTALNAIGRKRKITMACNFCRSRKLKCDGVKPACAQCIKRGNTCDYQQHAVVPQGPPSAPKDPISQARDSAGQANVILHGTHVNGHLTSPGVRHREREHGRDAERDREAPLYHSGRPYSPPPQGSSNPSSHNHSSYTPQNYPHPNYSRNREGSAPPPPPPPLPLPPSQHHSNAPGATHTWRYTSQSHAQAHAAARDSDVDELMEDNSEHEDRDLDMRTRGIKSNRDFAHSVHEPSSSNGNGGGGILHSVNGRKRVSVDMLIVEALGEGSTREPVEEDGSVGPANNNVGPTTAAATAVRTGRDRVKERGKGQDVVQSQQGQPPLPPPPPGQGGHYESGGPWYEMGMGVIDVGSEGDKKKRLNRQSANYGSKAVACVHCRARKTRCDAVRPACGNCARRSLSCSYNHVTPSQPRSKGKKATAAAAATLTSSSNPSSISAGSIGSMDNNKTDMGGGSQQRNNSSTHLHQQSHSPSVGRSPGQLGTTHGLPPSWHPQSHSSHSQSPLHHHPHGGVPHSPIRIDDHRLPIEESAERERPLTRSPQPPIATLNVPERSRSRSSSGSLSINLMENGNGNSSNVTFNVNGTSIPISRSRSTSNFVGPSIGELGTGGTSGKRKSPDISGNGEVLDGLSERGIIPERPDKRRKHWIENNSGESPVHLSNEVRVQ